MNIVTLKNGTQEAEPLVKVAMFSLSNLIEQDPIAFYELVMLCRDRSHSLFGNTPDKLHSLSLIEQSGQPHDSIRNVVLSAVSGDGLDMELHSPVA